MSLSEWQKENPTMKQDLKILYELVIFNCPKVIVEIGCGHSTMAMALALKVSGLKDSKVYSTDIDNNRINQFQDKINKEGLSDYCMLFDEDSAQFLKDFDCIADIIFIDSAHEYQKTLDEINESSKILSSKGFIFIHDTTNGNILNAIKEFMRQNKDWVYSNFPTQYGLGVLKIK